MAAGPVARSSAVTPVRSAAVAPASRRAARLAPGRGKLTPVPSNLVLDPREHRARDDRRATVEDLRALVTLSRTHRDDIGDRQVFARLDGRLRVTLLFGQSVTLEVEPGLHRMRIHNTLMWKNLTFAIEPGEHLEFSVVNSGRWWTYGIAGVLGAAPLFLRVERASRM
jgi:hypothetical protein